MKKIALYILLIICSSAFGQRKNDDDTLMSSTDPNSKETIYFNLNTTWFFPKESIITLHTTSDKKVEIYGPTITIVTLKDAVKNVKKQKLKYKLLQDYVIKSYDEYTYEGTDLISVAYGKSTDDGRLISMLVILPKKILMEWESYFDNVALSLSLEE